MTTWGEFVDKILRNTLRDEGLTTWSQAQVYDSLGWALDQFSSHTAAIKEVVYSEGSDGPFGSPHDMSSDTQFSVPYDNYEELSISAHIFSVDTAGIVTNYDPLVSTPGMSITSQTEPSFIVWPENIITIDTAPGEGSELHIRYFAYHDRPTIDNADENVTIPRWSEKAISTLVGAYSLEGLGVESSNIDRWKDETDSGNPEHNALRKQQEFLMKQYDYLISQHTPQDRTNFFRAYSESLTANDYYTTWGN